MRWKRFERFLDKLLLGDYSHLRFCTKCNKLTQPHVDDDDFPFACLECGTGYQVSERRW